MSTKAAASPLRDALDAGIVVCAGPGGVGKTTISAAIALEGARTGRRTIVVTIDPARRLADSLGLDSLPNTPHPVPVRGATGRGELLAMMLDTKSTFDELISRHARSRERAERILNNRFYQAIAGALSGTHEYMAMEKLYELATEDGYDLIVVDTPPTRSALDFLDAPKRLTSFLEGRLLRWFLLPAIGGGKGVFRALNFAAVTFLRLVTKVVGADVLRDTAEFFANFEGMYEGFKQRAQEVYDLLRDDRTRFVVVTAPTSESVREALFFTEALAAHSFPLGGLVVNRLHPVFDGTGTRATGSPLADRLIQVAADFDAVRQREEDSLERLAARVPPERWARVPFLNHEVVDLEGLETVADSIFRA